MSKTSRRANGIFFSPSSCFSFHKSRDIAGSCTAENSEKQNGETDGKGTSQPTVIMDWKAVGGTDNP